MSGRDKAYEAELLERALGNDQHDQRFAAAVLERLELGQQLYGTRSLELPLEELLREIREETLDVGAWSLLCAQSSALRALAPEVREHVLLALSHAVIYAAYAERVLHHAAHHHGAAELERRAA